MHDHIHAHHHSPDNAIPGDRQAMCPVTGDIVDMQEAEAEGHVREYQGKKYYFCCSTCLQLFDKHPDKYIAKHTNAATLTLREKEHLVDNIWAFRFQPNHSLSWTAGQFVRVELPHEHPDDEGTKRWFTVSSAPYEGIVQITTRVTESTFKQALHALSIGDELQLVEQPDGDFVWEYADKPLVFVAGGIGVTPFRSILKQRYHDNLPLEVTLIYGNRTDAIVFKDEFDAYVLNDPKFKVHYLTGKPLTAQKLGELVPDLNASLVYVSGPEPMVEALGDDLKAHGLPEKQLKQDFFPNYTEANY